MTTRPNHALPGEQTEQTCQRHKPTKTTTFNPQTTWAILSIAMHHFDSHFHTLSSPMTHQETRNRSTTFSLTLRQRGMKDRSLRNIFKDLSANRLTLNKLSPK